MSDESAESAALALRPEQPGAITEGPGALLQGIMALARDPSVRVEAIERLVMLQRSMEDREAERAFAAALRGAQAKVRQVERSVFVNLTKDGEKPKPGTQGGYFFAPDEDIDDMLRPIMSEFGFSIYYDRALREGGGLVVTATLLHAQGHSKTSSFPLPIDTGPGRNNLQALGSTDSYAHRYLKEGFFNIVRRKRDNDGRDAGKKFITEQQAEELRALCVEVKRQEGPFLERLFSGQVRSFDEIEAGSGYLAAKSTLEAIKQQSAKKGE